MTAMRFCLSWSATAALALFLLLYSCAVPQKMWPQKDMAASEIAGAANAPTVLLAARSSEFKVALVERLESMMAEENIRLKIVGVEDLKTVNGEQYDAVLVISTCLAWGFDEEVRSFIERHPNHDNMIFFTTSAAGDWMPDKEEFSYDAISSASELSDVESAARNIMSSVHSAVRRSYP